MVSDVPAPPEDVENPVLDKIVNFMNDNSYNELMKNTAKFNVRIRKDRRYRQPYIDGQTGVAQRDCHLFVNVRQRQESGLAQGQVFSYPARRWKAPHRSYLRAFVQPASVARDAEEHIITTVENPAASTNNAVTNGVPIIPSTITTNGDVVDTEVLEKTEPWPFYEENAFEELEEEIESEDNDDDETYDRKGRKRKGPVKKKKPKAKKTPSKPSAKAAKKTRNATPADDDDPESKPYVCERRGGRKPGAGPTPTGAQSSKPPSEMANKTGPSSSSDHKGSSESSEDSKHKSVADSVEPEPTKKKVSPSPYCDFCLGDATINKKTNSAEKLVSCADCGRSGHPTCLQFTANMMKSVSSYRWQCIECKTCTLCGTSENDDQLLFCDDCDRGYHLYCLSPPLAEPPEGEWSCALCIKNFHNNK